MLPTIPAEPIHSQNEDVRITPSPGPLPTRDILPPTRLGFSKADAAATLTFTKTQVPPTSAAEVVEHARSLAEALAGPDGISSRQRTLARRIAIVKTQAEHLDVLLGRAAAQRDFVAARELNHLLNGATKRLCSLIEQLARQAMPRAVVVSANTANVLVR